VELASTMLHACADFHLEIGDVVKVSAMIRLNPGAEPHTK
jgi:hypothetical protein